MEILSFKNWSVDVLDSFKPISKRPIWPNLGVRLKF